MRTTLIDNECGSVRGAVYGTRLVLTVRAETPNAGYFESSFSISEPSQLLCLYSVLLALEMRLFSILAARRGFGVVRSMANGQYSDGAQMFRFNEEVKDFQTIIAAGGKKVQIRIFIRHDREKDRERFLFAVKHVGEAADARFDMDVGELLAMRCFFEGALFQYPRLEVTMLDDITLSVTLIATLKALEFKIKTPYAKRKLVFEDAHHLASLAFWSERALAMRGNPLIRFGPTNRSGMLFWEHKETQEPFVRFEFGEQSERMNLTKYDLCCLNLFSKYVLRSLFFGERVKDTGIAETANGKAPPAGQNLNEAFNVK